MSFIFNRGPGGLLFSIGEDDEVLYFQYWSQRPSVVKMKMQWRTSRSSIVNREPLDLVSPIKDREVFYPQ